MFNRNKLYCFSPPVMIATFIIELALIFYVILFRKLNTSTRIGILLIFCLAVFQLAEYAICENLGLPTALWAKIGFTSITLLPPLGLNLVYSIANKKNSKAVILAYMLAAIWIFVFWFGNVMSGAVCEGNYVIFHFKEPFEGIYYTYYDSLLLGAMGIAAVFARTAKSNIKAALYWLIFGYTSFIIPSIIFANLDDYVGSDSPLPSILCGFAVILAVVISTKIIPQISNKKHVDEV